MRRRTDVRFLHSSPSRLYMLRFPSRLIDSFASAQTLPAASGRRRQSVESCRRRRSSFVMPFRTAFPSFPIYLFIRPIAEWRERNAVLFCFGRFRLHCRSSFRLLFDTGGFFCSSYTTPACTSDGQKSLPVFFHFRLVGSRDVLPGHYLGDSAALAGFREGDRLGKPMPRLSLFWDIPSAQSEQGYIQFKSRPSDRRHAYF